MTRQKSKAYPKSTMQLNGKWCFTTDLQTFEEAVPLTKWSDRDNGHVAVRCEASTGVTVPNGSK